MSCTFPTNQAIVVGGGLGGLMQNLWVLHVLKTSGNCFGMLWHQYALKFLN